MDLVLENQKYLEIVMKVGSLMSEELHCSVDEDGLAGIYLVAIEIFFFPFLLRLSSLPSLMLIHSVESCTCTILKNIWVCLC
jgi:hypothetical protein